MIFLDTETCGFHGPVVLIQYKDIPHSSSVILFDVWTEPIHKTLSLIEYFCTQKIIAFNLAFDWFHINQLYNIFRYAVHLGLCLPTDVPEERVPELFEAEKLVHENHASVCVKPVSCVDLMLVARKGKLQSMMNRKPIRVRKVPNSLAEELAEYLENACDFDDILFAKRKKKDDPRWKVEPRKNKLKQIIDPEFKDVVCRFSPSSRLNDVAKDALGLEKLEDAMCEYTPVELGYAPYADAVMRSTKAISALPYGNSWPDVIQYHKVHWQISYNRKYAERDVILVEQLYQHFGQPSPDNDSTLAALVGAVRFHGFSLDLEKLQELCDSIIYNQNILSPADAERYLNQYFSPMERITWLSLDGGTSSYVLEQLSKWDSLAGRAAREIIQSRKLAKKKELYTKLLLARRFYASFNVIGTKSNRMSGTDGLNPQGIDHTKQVRECFILHDDGYTLSGGDFSAFEISILDAVCQDEKLHEMLMSGMKAAGIFGQYLYEDKTYQEIIDSDGQEENYYTEAKSGLFAVCYGGEGYTLHNKIKGISLEQGDKTYNTFLNNHPGMKKMREETEELYCPVYKEGNQYCWREPKTWVESLLGFRRYFDLEYRVCRIFFDLMMNMPKDWINREETCLRRKDYIQTVGNATRSALLGAAYGLQKEAVRAIINHRIQSTGGEVTKIIQCAIWEHQPTGVHEWVVIPANCHDELFTSVKIDSSLVEKSVYSSVESLKDKIPLLKIKWETNGKNWAETH